MRHVIKRFLFAVALLTVISGTVGTFTVLTASSAHTEPCGGRGYPEGGGGSRP